MSTPYQFLQGFGSAGTGVVQGLMGSPTSTPLVDPVRQQLQQNLQAMPQSQAGNQVINVNQNLDQRGFNLSPQTAGTIYNGLNHIQQATTPEGYHTNSMQNHNNVAYAFANDSWSGVHGPRGSGGDAFGVVAHGAAGFAHAFMGSQAGRSQRYGL